MTILEAKNLVATADLIDKVPLISGKHGIGKSEIIKQYAIEQDLHNETVMLSLCDTGDIMGIPRTAEIGGQISTVWAAPSWFTNIVNAAWPNTLQSDALQFNNEMMEHAFHENFDSAEVSRSDLNDFYCNYTQTPNDGLHLHIQDDIYYTKGKRSVLFLDEFNRAPTDVLNASLQLILDKKLNSHVLPRVMGKETLVVAAINPADENYTTNEFDPALLDRFVFGSVEANLKAWLPFANSIKIDDTIKDFLVKSPKYLHFTPKDGSMGATPRSWVHLDKLLKNIDKAPKGILPTYLKGVLGDIIASEFLIHYNNFSKALSVEDVEAFIAKKMKRTDDVEKLAAALKKDLLKEQEPVQLTELVEALGNKYLKMDEATDTLPYLAFVYALPAELKSSYVQTLKQDMTNFKKLAQIDGEINNKSLFKSLVSTGK